MRRDSTTAGTVNTVKTTFTKKRMTAYGGFAHVIEETIPIGECLPTVWEYTGKRSLLSLWFLPVESDSPIFQHGLFMIYLKRCLNILTRLAITVYGEEPYFISLSRADPVERLVGRWTDCRSPQESLQQECMGAKNAQRLSQTVILRAQQPLCVRPFPQFELEP